MFFRRLRIAEELESRQVLTTATVTLLADIAPGTASAEFSDFASGGDKLYFDIDDTEIWRTDGTVAGTLKLTAGDRPDSFLLNAIGLTLFNVQTTARTSIWRTDGTPQGTFELITDRRFDEKNDEQFGNHDLLRAPVVLEAYRV